MPSALPTENSLSKTLDTYGLGPYDGARDEEPTGEDDETGVGPALPGIPDLPLFEPYIGYPQAETSQGKHATFATVLASSPALRRHLCGINADSILPGDSDKTPRAPVPNSRTKGGALAPTDVTNTVSHTELPSDGNNPAARSDYYDEMQTGSGVVENSISDIWPAEDSGAYAGEDSLPTPLSNDGITDNYTNPLGNSNSGFVIEDQNVPRGFPSTDFVETADYPKSNDGAVPGGSLVATGKSDMSNNRGARVATDIAFVEDLTSKFLKEHGKKNITRRAVTAFLQGAGHGDRQYIASDIVRCLRHNHNIIVPDALDIFPVKTASVSPNNLIGVYGTLLAMEMEHLGSPSVARELGTCASTIARTWDLLNRIST